MNQAEQQPVSNPPAKTRKIYRAISVDKCHLRFVQLRLRYLACVPGDSMDVYPPALLKFEGHLLNQADCQFISEIKWSLQFPEDQPAPISISGKHHAVFATDVPISKLDARYYAEVNAVILAFPYLRQLVDDLAVKSLGRNIMIPPLDVPKWSVEHPVLIDEEPQAEHQGTAADDHANQADSQ